MPPLRVLYLTINPNRVSTTVPTEGWFRILGRDRLEPTLISHEEGDFHRWAKQQGIAAFHVPLPLPSKGNPLPILRSLWRLWRIVRRQRIQLIHCNEQNCYPIGSYLARLTGLPIIVSVHFTLGRDFCSWAFGKHIPERVFFTSEGNRSVCQPAVSGIVPIVRQTVLNNGLDLEHYRPDVTMRKRQRSTYSPEHKFVLGVACALRARKQLEHLFEVARRLPADVGVVVAGGPISEEKDYSASLLQHGRNLLGPRLFALGHLAELRPFYNSLDLYVNTSQEEACSLSVLEALACGCPVVGYASKTVDSQILPGGGEITPQDDIEALAAAIRRWLSDPERLAAARLSARKRVESAFDIRVIAQDLLNDYHAVLAEFASDKARAPATQRLMSEQPTHS